MAGAKALKGRIHSVKNSRKITRTMEMVSTAKSKRMVDRSNAAKPYGDTISELAGSLSALSAEIESPLLRRTENPKKVLLLVVSANRGLCGGYNSNVLRLARSRYLEITGKGQEAEVLVIGKKGASFFRFTKVQILEKVENIDDTFKYEQALEIAEKCIDRFLHNGVDRVEIVSMHYLSSSNQKPGVRQVLPIETKAIAGQDKAPATVNVVCEPSPAIILKNLLPHVVRTEVYRSILEAVTSEWIARRIAMKSASDNAKEIERTLTRTYNRVRQAGITQAISEIVAGADAIG